MNIIPAQRMLYHLWFTPGKIMHQAWWDTTDMKNWQKVYNNNRLTRRPADELLRTRLDHTTPLPVLSEVTSAFLNTDYRRQALLISLGLWGLGVRALLLIRMYRSALKDVMDEKMINQLQPLLPDKGLSSQTEPDALVSKALDLGAAWLSNACDPSLRACRLLYSPAFMKVPCIYPDPILSTLVKWL